MSTSGELDVSKTTAIIKYTRARIYAAFVSVEIFHREERHSYREYPFFQQEQASVYTANVTRRRNAADALTRRARIYMRATARCAIEVAVGVTNPLRETRIYSWWSRFRATDRTAQRNVAHRPVNAANKMHDARSRVAIAAQAPRLWRVAA